MAGQSKVSRQRHKDKKVTIYKKKNVGAPGGMGTYRYQPIHPGKLWAYVRQLSASEYFAAKATQITEEILFVVNWRKDLANPNATLGLSLEYNGCWYNITRIDTFEGYKEDLQIYGKLTSTPKAEDILPYAGG